MFLSNFPASGWLSDERLRARREDLIYTNIIGNPDGGTAVDYTVNPASGFAYATGPRGGSLPTNHVLPAWDIATGLTAALGLLAAERVRTRTGVGQFVSVSLADVAFTMVADLGYLAQAQVLGEARPPIGNDMYGAFGRDFPTADDRRVMVVAISLRQWQSLVDAVGIGEHLPAIERAFQVDLTARGRSVPGARRAGRAHRPVGRRPHAARDRRDVRPPRRLLGRRTRRSPSCSTEDWRVSDANPVFRDIDQPGIGKVRAGGSPLAFGAISRDEPGPAPQLGQHTEQILTEELGLARRRDRRAPRPRHRGRTGLTMAAEHHPRRPRRARAVERSARRAPTSGASPPRWTPIHPATVTSSRHCGTGRSSRRRRRRRDWAPTATRDWLRRP